jgi:hypothetical protein
VFAGGAWVSTYPISVVQTAVGNAPAFLRIRSGLVPYGYSLALRCGFYRLPCPHGLWGSALNLPS